MLVMSCGIFRSGSLSLRFPEHLSREKGRIVESDLMSLLVIVRAHNCQGSIPLLTLLLPPRGIDQIYQAKCLL